MSEKCNGWTNYQTWIVIAIIDNTQSLYNFFKDAVKEVKEKYSSDERISPLIDILQNVVSSMKPTTTNDIWQSLIENAYESINFPEIARNMLEDY